ncbi:nucleotide sugar dehydratase [Candidatus Magnetobacterium bavaricum]|uniref:Nucleotide sugar dehydratase n=1 Tax=Candidatus Magnetobacterium bavaricum TaxID=29290 RepID=A0A0F3GK25_9BACT|nr:nucleotide sugar dehydratase [Candidatus Magnetobacterium bavaricum]
MNLKSKKIIVTGADGFIGSHLVENLLQKGYVVRAFICYNSFNSWGWLDYLSKDKLKAIEVIAGDVRDTDCVRSAIKGQDVVFHLAALISIPFSYNLPGSYIDTNIKGTLNVLQACKDTNIERVVITSTSEVYGSARYIPIDEKHPLQGQSPYSASKIGADKIAESFYRSFETPVVIARPFNTYGPRQSARAVIPTIITQLLKGSKEIRLGSVYPTRDLNFVDDICEGFIALAKCDMSVGKEINIGSGYEVSIENLAELIISSINSEATIFSEDIRKRPEKSEVQRLVCDNTLIRELTGWQSRVTLEEGLVKTIDWFKNEDNLCKYKADLYNV